jgi:hypothetical protein
MKTKIKKKWTFCATLTLAAFVFKGIGIGRSYARTMGPTPLKKNNFGYVDALVSQCGPLCTVGAGKFEPSLYFDRRNVEVSCSAIFSKEVFIQHGHGSIEAPRSLPERLLNDYTLHGKIKVTDFYFNQMYLTKTAQFATWTRELVENYITSAEAGYLEGNYGPAETNHLRSALTHAAGVQGGRVLVIGSEHPWVEACVLEAGAKSVTTLEYGRIISQHPKIETMTPAEFQQQYTIGILGTFDAIVSFSSVEHSGLGRYGDALNPWGDVLEVARAHCVCKSKGSLVLAVMYGQDKIEFNAHRVYGPARWPYLTSNWKQVYREEEGNQRVHVFEKQ